MVTDIANGGLGGLSAQNRPRSQFAIMHPANTVGVGFLEHLANVHCRRPIRHGWRLAYVTAQPLPAPMGSWRADATVGTSWRICSRPNEAQGSCGTNLSRNDMVRPPKGGEPFIQRVLPDKWAVCGADRSIW